MDNVTTQSILIIEDDPYVQRYLERLFRASNYVFTIVSSGEEGLEKAKIMKPALILLDLMMPFINGMQVLAQLKNDPDTKGIMVVILTNYGDDATVVQAKELGARDFIIKANAPPELLIPRINELLKEVEQQTKMV